ncbi:MAG: hypothetical protein BWY09_01450 [Candidatus Hydrogenedentes bacterium ADurb.Bin179]|nr:MAG: hypothetical protein BWY09_01450 [Candidatus Hydrogenedentes bacterium ADurb.Bin179]
MTTERFIIFLLLGALAYVYFFGVPDLAAQQRSSQPFVRATAAYTIDTSAPATVIINTPQWQTQVVTATPYPTATGTAVPSLPGLTLTSEGTPEPQRGEQSNERGCASYRSCEP